MKKLLFAFAVLLLSSNTIFADPTTVPLTSENDSDPFGNGSRSINAIPTASLDEPTLTVSFPMSTTSQVAILDAETDAVVYSAPYDATRQVEINLSSLSEGSYTLRVYAFGKWWTGEFVISDSFNL